MNTSSSVEFSGAQWGLVKLRSVESIDNLVIESIQAL